MPKLSGRPFRLFLFALALLFAASAFVLPYHVPVQPAVSQSYACGFSNRAALLLFLVAGLLFGAATGGLAAPADARNRRMPRWMLVAAVLATLLACAVWRVDRIGKPLGSESHYQLDRQVQMVGGLRLYKDLEFIYGPLLVYPGELFQQVFRTSPLRGYMASWFIDWLVGTAMLWWMIDWLELPTRFRVPIFLFLDFWTIQGMPSDGTHYTPIRIFCAGFLSVAAAACWRRTQAPVRTAAVMAGAILCGFLISPEQGTALALGLSAYVLLLAWKTPERFPLRVALLVPIASGVIVGVAGWAGVLRSMRGFARGGNNFPLLPSVNNFFVLAIYLIGIAVVYRAARERDWNNMALPVGLCGLAMMSSAFGRCDLEHITSAVPLFLLGIFWLAARPVTFYPWLAIACFLFFNFGAIGGMVWRALGHKPAPAAAAIADVPASGLPIPEGPAYFAPFALPVGIDGTSRWGAKSGYFFGIQNVLTAEDIAAKAAEIRERRAPFLLLLDVPGPPTMLFWTPERDIHVVQAAEGSWWAPQQLRPTPSTQAVTDAIEGMYAATEFREAGWRVWKLRG